MRFKKGSKVEVLNKSVLPSGSWRCAEIISGNGHTYSVRYDGYLPDMGVVTERVPRKAIRPCPLPLDDVRSWCPGDIVELFEKNCWKLAEVSGVAARNYFFVRLLGSPREFRAHMSQIRLRQSWKDGKWVAIPKECGKPADGLISRQLRVRKFSCQVPKPCVYAKVCDDHFPTESSCDTDMPYQKFPGDMKKRPRFHVGTWTGAVKRIRAAEKGGHQQLAIQHSSNLLEKVRAVASPRTVLGEKYMHASLYNRTIGCCEPETKKGKQNADAGYVCIGGLHDNDSESTSSSVGSCSSSSSPDPRASRPNCDLHDHFDDAESFGGPGRDLSLSEKEELSGKTRSLELYAYRQTMLALYASGPLSWEQEALLTNLRLMLNISNDEHLLELRQLVSADPYLS